MPLPFVPVLLYKIPLNVILPDLAKLLKKGELPIMKIAILIPAIVTITAMTIWAVGALYYSPMLPQAWRTGAAVSYAVITLLAFVFLPWRGRTMVVAVIAFAVLVGLFFRDSRVE